MKKEFTKVLIMALKFTLLGIFAQVWCFQLVLATESNAQSIKSVKDVTVNVNLENATIEEAFGIIESATQFSFNFHKADLNRDLRLNYRSRKVSVGDLLLFISKESGLKFKQVNDIINVDIITNPNSNESNLEILIQTRNVTGKVTSQEDPEGLPGVNVIEKGTNNGTVTDVQGTYSLEVSEGATLVFSSVGYTREEVEVGNRSVVDLVMSTDLQQLDELVVIGYGAVRKSDLTGSVVSVDMEEFREYSNVSIGQSLQGAVPGLNVGPVRVAGEDPSFLVRGQNTFDMGNTAPLIVVDGIIFFGSLVTLNPSDIESVNVLKDASSTAIYGSRASNGVILITTKTGRISEKPIFNYSGSYSTVDPAKSFNFLDREGFIKKVHDAHWREAYLPPDYTVPNPNFDVTKWWVTSRTIEGYNNGTDFDWIDAIHQTGHIMDHNLSMRGMNEQTSYYISGGYTDQLGYVMNDKYKRLSLRLNVENNILDWIKVGIQSFVSSSDYSGVTPHQQYSSLLDPFVTPYDENGELVPYPQGTGGLYLNPFYYSAVDDLNKRLDLHGTGYAIIDIPHINGLSYRLNYSTSVLTARQFRFSQFQNNFQGQGYKNHSSIHGWTFDNILTYTRSIQDHSINVTFLAGREEREGEGTNATTGFYNNMDLGYNRLDVAENQYTGSDAWSESSLYYMGRLNYGFNKRYLTTLTIRRDGFSGFSKANKFGVFPSAAIAWVASEENFMQDQRTINHLKLRTSYGSSGNRTLGRYATIAQVEASPNYVFGDGAAPSIGSGITSLANSNLGWETTTGLNLGLDFAILNNRLQGNVDYYNTNTTNILYSINIPTITGFSSILENIGKVHNKGIEFSLTGIPVRTQNFAWDMKVNFSRNRNQVKSIIGLDADGDGIEDDLIASSLFIGKPLGAIYNYEVEALYQIGDEMPSGWSPGHYKVRDLNNDGIISPVHDRKILGYNDPSYRFSINNSFQYKSLTLRMFINSVQGGNKWYLGSTNPYFGSPRESAALNSQKWDWWTPSNPGAKWEQLPSRTPLPGVARYFPRSFVRLQDISLAYQFNSTFIKNIGLQDLKIYISGKNLYTWSKWEGGDPEIGIGPSVYDVTNLSPMKNYTLGIDLTF
jgi:TonB-dependent starch-binding outer membrane protein SusC